MRKLFAGLGVLVMISSFAHSELSFKLLGGMTFISGDDYNRGVQGQMDYLKDAYTSVSGEYSLLEKAFPVQGAITYFLTPNFGVGIQSGIFKLGKESTVAATYTWLEDKWIVEPQLTVIPITLEFHALFPVVSNVGLSLNIGCGYYLTQFSYEWDYQTNFFDMALHYTFRGNQGTIGFHGGIGLELEILRNVFFVIQIAGHYAKITEIEGDWTERISIMNGWFDETESGSGHFFWYGEWESLTTGKAYPQVIFSDDPPSGSTWANVRKGELNLSGVSVLAGIRIGIF